MDKLAKGLKDLLFKLAGEKYRDIVLVALAWKSVVGVLMSERSKILRIDKKVLYVRVSNHVWMTEFVLLRPKIIKDLKEKTHIEIENILFSL
jgi:hypothetical protein